MLVLCNTWGSLGHAPRPFSFDVDDIGFSNDRRGDAYMNAFQRALATCPWFPIVGNHEYSHGPENLRHYEAIAYGEFIGEVHKGFRHICFPILRMSQRCSAPHAPCAMLYQVAKLT